MSSPARKSCVSLFTALILAVFAGGCAIETEKAINPRKVALAGAKYQGPKHAIAIDRFRCCATQTRPSTTARLEEQARALLLSHIQQTGCFQVLENPTRASETAGGNSSPTYVVSGDIIYFGRRDATDWELWGFLSSGRQQIACAKVSLVITHKSSGRVISCVQGEGQCKFQSRNYASFSIGETSSYDAVLSGKVVDLAIVEAVNRLSEDLVSGALKL
jgi:curli biogenesis system outer membrane secretion channel CsgG